MGTSDDKRNTMTSSVPLDGDASWGEQLRALEGEAAGIAAADLEAMYSNVRQECDQYDRKPTAYLKSQPTPIRRLIAFTCLGAIGVAAFFAVSMVDQSMRDPSWFATLAAYAALMTLAVIAATRPLQVPALPSRGTIGIAVLAVGATLIAALIPAAHAHHGPPSAMGFVPCMGSGLLLGIPVYAVVRLLDRGNALGGLLAAAAAGLAGNLLLKFHCPANDTAHVMAGHVSVAVIFVVGLGLVHWVIGRR